jgi:hypothetical protein
MIRIPALTNHLDQILKLSLTFAAENKSKERDHFFKHFQENPGFPTFLFFYLWSLPAATGNHHDLQSVEVWRKCR